MPELKEKTTAVQANLSILIIEDDFATRRQLMGKLVGDPHLSVEVGATLQEGMDWIAQREFDVILLDLGLPDGSGLELIKAVTGRLATTQILVLSAMRDEASVVTAISAGAGGYIVKDAASEDVLKAVYNIRNGFAPLSPSIARFILRQFRQQSQTAEATTPQPSPAVPPHALQFGLTAREYDVLVEITRGASYKQIARKLVISEATVQSHIKNIYRKLGVSNRSEASFRFSSQIE